MSNLTDLLPAGAGGKQVDFVASGTIGNGVTVGLNSDGTVEAVAAFSAGTGSEVVYETGSTTRNSSVYDTSSEKVIIAYTDIGNSYYGTAVVGTVSGKSISFGSPVVFTSTNTQAPSITHDTNANKIVIGYRDNDTGGRGNAVVGTVSGTSISFGTTVNWTTRLTDGISATYDSSTQKVVFAYRDEQSNLFYGTAIVGTVSGTSISFGSSSYFNSANTSEISAFYDSTAEKIVIGYRDNGDSSYGKAKVATVSGTSISFGSDSTFEAASTSDISGAYDSTNNKTVFVYSDGGNSSRGTAVVGTVSGTSISFGTPVVFETGGINNSKAAFDSTAGKIVVVYEDSDNSDYGTYNVGTVSGTSISFETPAVFNAASTSWPSISFDSSQGISVFAYIDQGNSNRGTAICFQNAGTNVADFIGISDAAISDTATGSVTIKGGISTNVTGLTPNATYYVQDNGTLATTSSDVLAGKALSATSINLDYTT